MKLHDGGWSPQKTWREECGVFAAVGMPHAAGVVGLGLHALQHRGQESTGIVSCDEKGEFRAQGDRSGSDVYDDGLSGLHGHLATAQSLLHDRKPDPREHPAAARRLPRRTAGPGPQR
jgi:hypothetical protein